MIPEKLLKPYDPQNTENRIYEMWEKSGLFNPDTCIEQGFTKKDADAYTIIMPPPNVTGVLHLGHVLGATLQDVAIRFNRMSGKRTLWIPGTDHAAIATQAKVEKEIQKSEGKSRHDLGREELMKRIETFAQQSHDTIVSQLKVTGASCDWSREAYTLDDKRNLGVKTIFKQMYDDGLIYRGFRVVNWDPKGQTTISDDEIVYEERKSTLYTFKYSADFPIAISTSRPETKFGDTAVAVHPDDARYKEFIGKEFSFEFCGVPVSVKIIADKEVDPEFGTGALGVTPAHSQIDFAMAERHDLPVKPVINEYAKMSIGDDRILNKKTTEARAAVVEWLRADGLMIEEKEITQNVATAERTNGIIEPLPKLQWFIAVNKAFTKNGKTTTLKDIMRNAVASGSVQIMPNHFDKTYFHWIDNLRDWCISRQIWYGHRIPVWYKGEEIHCGIEAPEGAGWVQDEDTLDTWFSSGLWSFSTLGWPEMTNDLKTYHPTNLLVTAYEILFFWVARMIMMTGYTLNQVPFHSVLITGIVRDAKGQKFSKSLGNGIDPIDMAGKFSMDATRLALVLGTAPGTDMKISEEKIRGYRNFGNKIWNITRFILTGLADYDGIEVNDKENFSENDLKILDDHNKFLADITKEIVEFKYHIASEKIYHYIWHTLADVIIEDSKSILDALDKPAPDPVAKKSRQSVLAKILRESIIILHPFMPFVTEEIWSLLPKQVKMSDNMLIVEKWPVK